MKTVLERAREEAFVSREQAAAYLAQVKACVAEGYSGEEDVPFAARSLEEAQATLDAIDAAIAAGTPVKEPKPLRIPFLADTSGIEQAIAKAKLNRVDLELDFGRQTIRIGGDALDAAKVMTFLLKQGEDLATGGIAGADVEPGLVGEQPAGETVVSRATDEELRLKGAELMGKFVANSKTSDRPIKLGDTVEARTKFRVIGISERSTDGLNLGVSDEDGPFCQLEVQACGTIKTLELLASDLRRL